MTDNGIADVTVVIPTFNRAKYLPEALESILGQTMRPARVVVVDDGSTDDTALVMRRFMPSVEYVRRANGGKASALAMMMPSITTEYTWFFDDDDAAYPTAMEDLLKVASESADLGFAFGCNDIGRTESRLLASPVHRGRYEFQSASPRKQRLRLFRDCTVMMSGSLLRTRAIRTVGGLNPEQVRCQDYDLLVRLAASYPFRFCGSSVYIWRSHDGVRGSATALHAFKDRLAGWSHYNEVIGYFLRYQLPLSDFLGDPDADITEPPVRRSALIARAWATAPKLPLHLPVSDLVEAFSFRALGPLNEEECEYLRECFHDDFIGYRPVTAIFRLWRLGWSREGRAALTEMARGIYWIGHTKKRPYDRIRLIGASFYLRAIALAFTPIMGRDES